MATLKLNHLTLAALMAVGLATTAPAQTGFPDAPQNHWAYEALKNLEGKVLFGYPDGLYRGNRPMSRYEFAVAIHNLYRLMMDKTGELEVQVAALEKMIKTLGGPATGQAVDLSALRTQLAQLNVRIGAAEAGREDMRKLMAEFEKEITGLGVDVDAMKKDLQGLDKRITVLESSRANVMINGDINLLMLAGHSIDGRFGLTQDQWLLGRGTNAYNGQPVGMTRDLTILHEAAFTFSGAPRDGVKWNATLVSGNLLSSYGPQNGVGGNRSFADRGGDFYFQDFWANFDGRLVGLPVDVKIGRVGHKVFPLLFQRRDGSRQFENPRWDNGEWIFDGGILAFDFGGTKMNVFGGRTAVSSFDNVQINPTGLVGATAPIGQMLGVDFAFRALGTNMKAGYILQDADSFVFPGGRPANRKATYGLSTNFNLGVLRVNGAFAASQLMENTRNRLDNRNHAYDVRADYIAGDWAAHAGYRSVDQYYLGPAAIKAIGTYWGPTGFKGVYGGLLFKLNPALTFTGSGEILEGSATEFSLLRKGDDGRTFNLGLNYAVNPSFNLWASYDDVLFQIGNAKDQTQRWYTIGSRWTMSPSAFLRMQYQVSNLDMAGGRFRGGLLSTQLSIKF